MRHRVSTPSFYEFEPLGRDLQKLTPQNTEKKENVSEKKKSKRKEVGEKKSREFRKKKEPEETLFHRREGRKDGETKETLWCFLLGFADRGEKSHAMLAHWKGEERLGRKKTGERKEGKRKGRENRAAANLGGAIDLPTFP